MLFSVKCYMCKPPPTLTVKTAVDSVDSGDMRCEAALAIGSAVYVAVLHRLQLAQLTHPIHIAPDKSQHVNTSCFQFSSNYYLCPFI